jgi:hypothetical protein
MIAAAYAGIPARSSRRRRGALDLIGFSLLRAGPPCERFERVTTTAHRRISAADPPYSIEPRD